MSILGGSSALRGIQSSLNSFYGFSPPTSSLTMFTSPYAVTRAGGSGTYVNPVIGDPDVVRTSSGGSTGTGTGRSVFDASSINDLVAQIVAANNANIGNAAQRASELALNTAQMLDPYMAQQFYENLGQVYPDWQGTVQQQVQNTQQYLQGVIPDDAADLIRMYSAEQGMQGAHANTARNLGLTTLDLMNLGFTQGTQLASQSQYLMPPMTDVSAWAGQYFGALNDASVLRPADALQAALTQRGQDLESQWRSQSLSFEREKLRLQSEMFNAEMSWSRELSAMNAAYDKWKFNTEMNLYKKSAAARSEEQKTLLNAYRDVASTLKGMSGSSSKSKPAPGTKPKTNKTDVSKNTKPVPTKPASLPAGLGVSPYQSLK